MGLHRIVYLIFEALLIDLSVCLFFPLRFPLHFKVHKGRIVKYLWLLLSYFRGRTFTASSFFSLVIVFSSAFWHFGVWSKYLLLSVWILFPSRGIRKNHQVYFPTLNTLEIWKYEYTLTFFFGSFLTLYFSVRVNGLGTRLISPFITSF